MRRPHAVFPSILAMVAAVSGHSASIAVAQDQLSRLVSTSSPLRAFGYDPVSDTVYLTQAGSAQFVKVAGVSTGSPTVTDLVFQTTLARFYRDGDPDLEADTTGTANGILLNPLAIGSNEPFSFAIVTDTVVTRAPQPDGTRPVDAEATKRLYAFDLGVANPIGDGTDVFSTRVTLADMQAAAGSTSTSTGVGRQMAWSGDGQSVYFTDSSPNLGGLWVVGALEGSPVRILAEGINSEPGVRSVGGVDRIYFTGGDSTGNTGGIDFVTYDGTTTGPRSVALSAETLRDFFEVDVNMSSQRIASVAFHGEDMYFSFFNNNSDARSRFQGLYRVDAEGRISKVANRTEREAAFGSVSQILDRLQPREIEYTGSAEPFQVTQILYRESGANAVAGAIAFKPGDFNRDNEVTAADIDLFRQQVTSRGVLVTDVANLKFDMNGNNVVDWKDVQILEQFLDYLPPATLAGRVIPQLTIKADINLDGVVDFADFRIMRDNYAPGVAGRSFIVGDSSGDDRVDFADLQPWVNSEGYRSAVIGAGVPETPFDQAEWDAFLAMLTPPDVVLDVASGTSTQFEQGYRSIVIAASVTKTGAGAVVFDGANSYAGTTVVAEGSLIIDPEGTFGTSTLVDVRAGATLDVSGLADGFTVAAGQTLAGSGTIHGSVVFGQGSTLAPGLASAAISGLGSLGGLSSGGPASADQVAVVPEPAFTPLAVIAAAAAGVNCGVRRRRFHRHA